MKPEQADLLRKSKQSLDAAKLMEQQSYHDFAASRAYYAMFYVAEAMLLQYGLSFSKHSAVIAAFGERFAKTRVVSPAFHRYLIEGQDSRNVADYSLGPGLTQNDAALQIARAEEFLELAVQHLGPIPPTGMTTSN
jgi:uncharacterized protein (UPF0332 family)